MEMDKKLTLSLNKSIIENAKVYAREHNISLSKLIESYLNSLTQQPNKQEEITPLVKSLSGVIDLPADFGSKKAYTDYLERKYQWGES